MKTLAFTAVVVLSSSLAILADGGLRGQETAVSRNLKGVIRENAASPELKAELKQRKRPTRRRPRPKRRPTTPRKGQVKQEKPSKTKRTPNPPNPRGPNDSTRDSPTDPPAKPRKDSPKATPKQGTPKTQSDSGQRNVPKTKAPSSNNRKGPKAVSPAPIVEKARKRPTNDLPASDRNADPKAGDDMGDGQQEEDTERLQGDYGDINENTVDPTASIPTEPAVSATNPLLVTLGTGNAQFEHDAALTTLTINSRDGQDENMDELEAHDAKNDHLATPPVSMSINGEDAIQPILNPSDDKKKTIDDGGSLLGAIIVIGGGGVVLSALVFGVVYCRQATPKDGSVDHTTTWPSTQAGSSVPTSGDASSATVDYDYPRLYRGTVNPSLSDVGATLGSRTNRPEIDDNLTMPSSGNTFFSGDLTFDQAYTREGLLLDIYAPAGKLGVVIDNPDDGAPVVQAVKDTSSIAEKIHVGDKIVALDDEDIRARKATDVSMLISRKSNSAFRKLTVLRQRSSPLLMEL